MVSLEIIWPVQLWGSELQFTPSLEGLRHQIARKTCLVDLGLQPRARSAPEETLLFVSRTFIKQAGFVSFLRNIASVSNESGRRYRPSARGASEFSPARQGWVPIRNNPERRRCDTLLAAIPRFLLCLLLFLFLAAPTLPQSQPSPAGSRSLFSQSAAEILQREFSNSGASYLLLDARSGALLGSHWENYEKPIPLGSLVKPFTALAYAGAHEFRYPIYECKGKANGCWQVQPHGKLYIVAAISISFNA